MAETKPDIVIAIDALAARSTRRLNRTTQITDTGINPGSGVGNHRVGLTEENLQVKVIGKMCIRDRAGVHSIREGSK